MLSRKVDECKALPIISTAAFMSTKLMLSSMTRDSAVVTTPGSSINPMTSATSSSDSHSTSICAARPFSARL